MATLDELLAIDQELQTSDQAPTQGATIDQLLSIQSELDQPGFDLESFDPAGPINVGEGPAPTLMGPAGSYDSRSKPG